MARPPTPADLGRLIAELDKSIPLDDLPPVSTSEQVAKVVISTAGALAQDRYAAKGIPYTRIGKRVRYLRADVLMFLAANRVGGAA